MNCSSREHRCPERVADAENHRLFRTNPSDLPEQGQVLHASALALRTARTQGRAAYKFESEATPGPYKNNIEADFAAPARTERAYHAAQWQTS